MNAPLDVNRRDATLELTLNRPECRNALSQELITRLKDAFHAAEADVDVRSVILTGAPPSFCAGLDLREVAADGAAVHDTTPLLELFETIDRLPKPVLAAVNGPAVAGGAGLVSVTSWCAAKRRGSATPASTTDSSPQFSCRTSSVSWANGGHDTCCWWGTCSPRRRRWRTALPTRLSPITSCCGGFASWPPPLRSIRRRPWRRRRPPCGRCVMGVGRTKPRDCGSWLAPCAGPTRRSAAWRDFWSYDRAPRAV